MATTALLAVLATGTTIALEAVGLLFQHGAPRQAEPDIPERPLREPEALLFRPLEALDRARRIEGAEGVRPLAKTSGARLPASEARGLTPSPDPMDEKRYLADAMHWAEQYRQRQEAEHLAALELEGAGPLAKTSEAKLPAPEARGLTPSAWAPEVVAAVAEAGHSSDASDVRVAEVPGASPPRTVRPPAHRPPARPHRPRRAGAGRSAGCPFLGWLQTLL